MASGCDADLAAAEQPLAGQRLPQHRAHAEQVALMVARFAQQLFGGGVGQAGQLGGQRGGEVHQPGGTVVGHQDVRGANRPVQQPRRAAAGRAPPGPCAGWTGTAGWPPGRSPRAGRPGPAGRTPPSDPRRRHIPGPRSRCHRSPRPPAWQPHAGAAARRCSAAAPARPRAATPSGRATAAASGRRLAVGRPARGARRRRNGRALDRRRPAARSGGSRRCAIAVLFPCPFPSCQRPRSCPSSQLRWLIGEGFDHLTS